MPNKNYVKGRRKEYAIIKNLKQSGCRIAHRTAGSHSPIDVFGIDIDSHTIKLIQAKPDSMSEKKKRELEEEFSDLNGLFTVSFRVI